MLQTNLPVLGALTLVANGRQTKRNSRAVFSGALDFRPQQKSFVNLKVHFENTFFLVKL